MGIDASNIQNYKADTGGVRAAFKSLSKASTRYEGAVYATQAMRQVPGHDGEDPWISAGEGDARTLDLDAYASSFFEGSNDAQEDFEQRSKANAL